MTVIVVRYADDLVVGFQHRTDAERFLKEFRERLAKFGLELHPDKTRLIEFGWFAARDRKARGEGKPETFTFLGFTHYCGQRHKVSLDGFELRDHSLLRSDPPYGEGPAEFWDPTPTGLATEESLESKRQNHARREVF